MPHPSQLAIEILKAAQKWRRTRVALKKALDSKSASEPTKTSAKRAYQEASDALETLVAKLDMLAQGRALKKKAGKDFPWREMLSGIAGVAQILDAATKQDLSGMPKDPAQTVREVLRPKRPPAGTVNEDGTIEAEVMDDE